MLTYSQQINSLRTTSMHVPGCIELTHLGWVTHICVSKLTIIASDYGLAPGRHHAIIWSSAGFFLIGPLGTNISDILIRIHTFSLKKMHLKILPGKWWPFCLGINVLMSILTSLSPSLSPCLGSDYRAPSNRTVFTSLIGGTTLQIVCQTDG